MLKRYFLKPVSPLASVVKWGLTFFLLHSALALLVFLTVQFSNDSQAGFVWFLFDLIDYPAATIGRRLIGEAYWMQNLVEYWYTIGHAQGPNIRSLMIVGIFGGSQWFLIGMAFRFLLLKVSWRAKHK